MKRNLLLGDQTLFRDRDVFEIDYLPELLNYREAQLEELALAIQPALYGARPFNTVLRGLPGTGKTTSVRRIFADIEETTQKVVPVYVNCQNDATKFAVFARIYAKLYGHGPPTSGVAFRRVLDAIGHALIDRKAVLIVCLDDANYLLAERVLNGTLYSILRLYEEFPGVRSGVFVIVSNLDLQFSRELDGSAMSVFQPNEVYFPPYTYDEVRGILKERAHAGLYYNVLSSEMLDLIAEKTMESGDLRVGIDLIRRSVTNADRAGRTEVAREDVAAGFEVSRHVHLQTLVRALNEEDRGLLCEIAELERTGGGEMSSGAVFKVVKERLQIGYTTFYNRLKKLDEMRLIALQARGEGNKRVIVLRYDAERVVQECR